MDTYRNFSELAATEREEVDFRIRLRSCLGASTVIIAPHGGGIEPGTSEISLAIAGEDLSFALFEGIKSTGNAILHITSANFDEPKCLDLVRSAHQVIAIHGENSDSDVVFVGGKDTSLGTRIRDALTAAGFRVERHPNAALQGTADDNICNRNKQSAGVQFELSRGLRAKFFQALNAAGRKHPTPDLTRFANTVRKGLGLGESTPPATNAFSKLVSETAPSANPVPTRVRESALVLALNRKLSALQPVSFDYWGQFNFLRARVAAEVTEISRLFPQFTPHDEELHLARLFGIADKLIGPERYELMNAAELFLLACGLYAHDWGMAVGAEEIAFLQGGAIAVPASASFTPLDDEALRLRQFADKLGLRRAGPPYLDREQMGLYIRRTHAWRSGVRARAFFHTVGSSVPQALELVCQGHWLDFSELDDEMRFSSQFGVLGYTVNLRAIALYVRLVDLFDIADDRTPFAVWRFVAPEDPTSRMEWSKHRALSPVTFPVYNDGRSVRFDGRTADPEVWAELQDLGRYCQEQITGTIDLLARHPDSRHQLDLRKLEWRITAERFHPVNLRFEFHRARMFEILANEIYQGDSHVFLRELLQNSIDAIATRRALVRQRTAAAGSARDVGMGFDDAIYFRVERGPEGDALVQCTDAGIGMDEYIVRNYLSVAGVSYYRSEDFKNLQLNLDPISTFGIGILSCFMVASRVDIVTRRDPLIAGTAAPIRLEIPAVDRQFRVYAGDTGAPVGTSVTVHVQGLKLKGDLTKDKPAAAPRLKVTEYLAAIAGFVEFPIVVDEDGKRTVILHPDRPVSDGQQFSQKGSDLAVRQLSRGYPWAAQFAPQDMALAAECLKTRSFNLHEIVGAGIEGWLIYVETSDLATDVERGYDRGDYDRGHYDLLEITPPIGKPANLRIRRFYGRSELTGLSPSSRKTSHAAVYRKGILVSDAKFTRAESRFLMIGVTWPQPALVVNFTTNSQGRLDVARRTLLGVMSWDETCWQAAREELGRTDIARAIAMPPAIRWDVLSKLSVMFHLSEHDLKAAIPISRWPIPALTAKGEITFVERSFAPGDQMFEVPTGAEHAVREVLGGPSVLNQPDKTREYYSGWVGPESIVLGIGSAGRSLVELWGRLTEWRVGKILAPTQVRFLSNAYPGLPPLAQTEFVCVSEAEHDEATVWERAMNDPLALTLGERAFVRNLWWPRETEALGKATPLAPPFQSFLYGCGCVNLAHPVGKALFQCAAALRYHQLRGSADADLLGKLEDRLREALADTNRCGALWADFVTAKLHPGFVPPRSLKDEDFLHVAKGHELMSNALHPEWFKDGDKLLQVVPRFYRPFGRPLESTEPEQVPKEIVTLVKSLTRKSYV